MKSTFPRISAVLAVFALLAASTFIGTAQEKRVQQPQAQQQEMELPELVQRDQSSESLRVEIPRECKGITPVVQTHDVNDNFNPQGSPVSLSPLLTTWLNGKPIKGYDDNRIDKIFADSFKLRGCRVCYATLEYRARHQPGPYGPNLPNYSNDTILAGAAPFTVTSPALRFIGSVGSVNIWGGPTPLITTPPVTLGISPGGLVNLNNYLSSGPMPPFMDIVAQDDTDFDYMTLRVWYFY